MSRAVSVAPQPARKDVVAAFDPEDAAFWAEHKGLMSHDCWRPAPLTDSGEPVRNSHRHLVPGVDRAVGLPEPYGDNPLLGEDGDQLAEVAVSGVRIATASRGMPHHWYL